MGKHTGTTSRGSNDRNAITETLTLYSRQPIGVFLQRGTDLAVLMSFYRRRLASRYLYRQPNLMGCLPVSNHILNTQVVPRWQFTEHVANVGFNINIKD